MAPQTPHKVRPAKGREAALIAALLAAAVLPAGAAGPANAPAEPNAPARPKEGREILPDFSRGLLGILGPFYWARALDLGEDARFSDSQGRPDEQGSFLWCHQFSNLSTHPALRGLNHGRNNFTSRDPNVAFRLQPYHYLLNTTQPHNSKVIVGYMSTGWKFTNGDNCDLPHLAGADRVCVFFPVRIVTGRQERLDQTRYVLNTNYANQAVCVVEFARGEMIRYDWFRGGPGRLDRHILMDLAPYFQDANALQPGVTRPLIQFDIHGRGRWTLRIERDGRDGLAGGDRNGDWDLTFTEKSRGAKPYTVDVAPAGSAWNLSVFSPGGRPAETSEILLGLQPYDRRGGKDIPWPDRSQRIRNIPPDKPPSLQRGGAARAR